MLKFTDYYGNDCWIAPERVLSVHDGGCGSLGVSAIVVLDTGKTVSVAGWAHKVAQKIAEAKL